MLITFWARLALQFALRDAIFTALAKGASDKFTPASILLATVEAFRFSLPFSLHAFVIQLAKGLFQGIRHAGCASGPGAGEVVSAHAVQKVLAAGVVVLMRIVGCIGGGAGGRRRRRVAA